MERGAGEGMVKIKKEQSFKCAEEIRARERTKVLQRRDLLVNNAESTHACGQSYEQKGLKIKPKIRMEREREREREEERGGGGPHLHPTETHPLWICFCSAMPRGPLQGLSI